MAQAELAMIPIENSVAGRVADIHHLLPHSNFHIIGEHFLPIQYQLVVAGREPGDIKVGSQPCACTWANAAKLSANISLPRWWRLIRQVLHASFLNIRDKTRGCHRHQAWRLKFMAWIFCSKTLRMKTTTPHASSFFAKEQQDAQAE